MYVDVFIFGCFFRQEVVVQDQGDSLAAPFLTFCPIFADSLVFPAKGFENKDLTFEKYTLMQERNFLLKNYSYSGYGYSYLSNYATCFSSDVTEHGAQNGSFTATTFFRRKNMVSNAIRILQA